jgi:hypothetical protein
MTQTLIAVLTVAGFVLAVDLVTTWLRKRVRSRSVPPELLLTEEEAGGEPNEGVALE